MIEEIDDESWQIREVYAKYGLAMYTAQCLETGLVNLLTALKMKQGDKMTRSDIDSFFEENYKKTLGGLISSLRQSMEISENLESDLGELLDLRNYLAHRYFREKAVDLMKEGGRRNMLSELDVIRLKLEDGDKRIDLIFSAYRKKFGISDEMINRKVSELLK